MDLTVLNLAVPKISADLNPSSTELLWIIDIYGFVIAGSLITMGTLGDQIRRRRPSLIKRVRIEGQYPSALAIGRNWIVRLSAARRRDWADSVALEAKVSKAYLTEVKGGQQ